MVHSVFGLDEGGTMKTISSTFAQMLNRVTNVDFTTVSPTIANTILGFVVFSSFFIVYNMVYTAHLPIIQFP